jgi:hypothetical protein
MRSFGLRLNNLINRLIIPSTIPIACGDLTTRALATSTSPSGKCEQTRAKQERYF